VSEGGLAIDELVEPPVVPHQSHAELLADGILFGAGRLLELALEREAHDPRGRSGYPEPLILQVVFKLGDLKRVKGCHAVCRVGSSTHR
jgi:hypothetical protein